MRSRPTRPTHVALPALLLLALAAPVAAQEDVIPPSSDAWTTAGDGSTSAFLELPRDFLCPGWSFAGNVALQGVPVVTEPADAFAGADTIVTRFEEAKAEGGETAVVVTALHFEGTASIESPCGSWRVDVGLAGEQSPTKMVIERTSETGGTFDADISVKPRWTFTNEEAGKTVTLDVEEQILSSRIPTSWRAEPCEEFEELEKVAVDSDNDGKVDRDVPGRSKAFNPGFGADCRREKPCREKNVDPVKHCYEPSGKDVGGTCPAQS